MAELSSALPAALPVVEEQPRRGDVPVPQRELLDFIDSVLQPAGQGAARFLTDIWLDEVARMEYLPSPASPAWKLVTLAASARLTSRLMEGRLDGFEF